MLVYWQVIAVTHCEAVEHFLHGDGTLPGDDMLIKVGHGLTLVGGRFEVELVA